MVPDTENPVDRSHGMAIYLPAPGLNISRDLLKYSTLSCNQGDSVTWVDFVAMRDAIFIGCKIDRLKTLDDLMSVLSIRSA